MALKHSHPTRDRRDKDRNYIAARAPYNFVPLPEKVVEAQTPPDQDRYQGHTGYIECQLETCSPTYIRGMMNELTFKEQGRRKPENDEESRMPYAHAPFFATNEDEIEGHLQPVIPGSSLRGMIRHLAEIVGHGHMRWVADQPKFTFRAVAAAKDDPLREPYDDLIGRLAKNVHAGYLIQDKDKWWIQPARRWPTREQYIKIKDEQLKTFNLPNYLPFNDEEYRPQIHQVSVDPETSEGRKGRFIQIKQMGPRQTHRVPANLICAGNMLETGQKGVDSPRTRQVLMLPLDQTAPTHRIPAQVIKDYLDTLTLFQTKKLTDWSPSHGCLGHLKPVFYVLDQKGEEVVAFGHSPNFRIPAFLKGTKRAATPEDFVPEELQTGTQPDLVEAIFGWVQEEKSQLVPGHRAGRLFVEDATFVSAQNGVWYDQNPIIPRVLAGPKPTAFQHYLVQDKQNGHDPDSKQNLAHYGTSPQETQIRGYKLYWHRGTNPPIKATENDKEHDSQLTQMIPLKPGVKFSFRIHFENLRPEELGLILWVLNLPSETGQMYRHKLGMGKPLGMGAVSITTELFLTARPERYTHLFQGSKWHEAVTNGNSLSLQKAFEHYLLEALGYDPEKISLVHVERIKMLLAMLQWREGNSGWLETTRYMEIERGTDKVNEYKERPVLPDPLHVQ